MLKFTKLNMSTHLQHVVSWGDKKQSRFVIQDGYGNPFFQQILTCSNFDITNNCILLVVLRDIESVSKLVKLGRNIRDRQHHNLQSSGTR